MFNLDARVGLDEMERATGLDQKLDRAQPAIATGPPDGDRRVQQSVARGIGEVRRGGKLDHLLVPPLNGAIALPQMGDVLTVADDLHLDMAHRLQEPFRIKLIVAKGGQCLGLRLREGRVDLLCRLNDTHPAPAAAVHRLDHQRRAALGVKERMQVRRRRQQVRTAQHRHARRFGQRTGRHLVPCRRNVAPSGPTKTRPAAAQASAKSARSLSNP